MNGLSVTICVFTATAFGFFVGKSWTSPPEIEPPRKVEYDDIRDAIEMPLIVSKVQDKSVLDPFLYRVDWWNDRRWFTTDQWDTAGNRLKRKPLVEYTGYMFSDALGAMDQKPLITPSMLIHVQNGEPVWMASENFRCGFIDGRPRQYVSWEGGYASKSMEVDAKGTLLYSMMIHSYDSDDGRQRIDNFFNEHGTQVLSVKTTGNGTMTGLSYMDKEGKYISLRSDDLFSETKEPE